MDQKQEELLGEIPPEILFGAVAFGGLRKAINCQIEDMFKAVSPDLSYVFAPVFQGLRSLVRITILEKTEGREQWEFAFYVPKLEITSDFRCSLPARLTVGCPSDPLEEPRHEWFDVQSDTTLDWILGWLGPRRVMAVIDPTPCIKDRVVSELWHVMIPVRDERLDPTSPITVKLPNDHVEVLEYPLDTTLTVAAIIKGVHKRVR